MRSRSNSRFLPVEFMGWVLLIFTFASLSSPSLFALDPSRRVTQYGHEAWQQEQGLPQNSIWAIAQTPDGYLWFGTEEGLVRFDGVSFRVFDKKNTPELKHHSINSLLVDRQGTLWIGTNGAVDAGLCRWAQGRFESYGSKLGLPGASVRCLWGDRDGSLWVGTGVGLVHVANGASRFYGVSDGLSSERIMALRQDGNATLFIGTTKGLHMFSEGRIHRVAPRELGDQSILAMCGTPGGGLIVGTQRGELWRSGKQGIERIGREAGPPLGVIQTMALDRGGSLWVGSWSKGLFRGSENRFKDFERGDNLGEDGILSLFEDREGSLWIGTRTAGLHRLRDTAFSTHSTREGLSAAPITALLQSHDGTMWIGTNDHGGVNRLRDGRVTLLGKREGLLSDGIRSLAEGRNGEMWIGTYAGLNRFQNGKIQHYSRAQGLTNDYILSLCVGSEGSLWIGTAQGGLNRLKAGRISSYSMADGLPNLSVHCLREGRDGGLWIGTGRGLAQLKDGKITVPFRETATSGYAVMSLMEEGDGTLWLGTEGEGLKRLKNGKLAWITTREGLFNDTLFSLLEDGLGNLWMSCNKGVFRASKRELGEVADGVRRSLQCLSFGAQDGMRSSECNGGLQPSGWRAQDGRLWFATIQGVVVVDPAHLSSNTLPPPVKIEDVRVDQKLAQLDPPVRVPPGAKSLEIHYTALSFLVPERVRFRYRLEGFDHGWIDAGSRRTAYYTHLPPGTYQFRVLACNNDGVWNLNGASLSFKVEPHFYETYWFYGLGGLLIFSLGGFIQRHFQRVRIFELEMQNRALGERQRLARDVHDQLSQTMTGLLLQLEAAGHALLLGADRCRPYLERAAELAREGIRETRRTVQGLRATALDDGDLLLALEGIAHRLTEGTEVQVEVRQAGSPFPLPRSMENDLFRMGQEGITNALRHSHARRIEAFLAWEERGVRLVIRDDGRGIDSSHHPSIPSAGLGLSGMWERIATDKGTLKVGNRPEGGTEVEIFIPRQEARK